MQGQVWLVAALPGKGQIWGSLMAHFWFEYETSMGGLQRG